MLLWRQLGRPRCQETIGFIAAEYLRLCGGRTASCSSPRTSTSGANPSADHRGFWHGQHFMAPFPRRGHKVKVLISRHRDGEINAAAAQRLGVDTIRGSGDHGRGFDLKGGVGAFRTMLDALQDG